MQGKPVCLIKGGHGQYRNGLFQCQLAISSQAPLHGANRKVGWGLEPAESPTFFFVYSVKIILWYWHWVQLGQSSTCKDYQ